MRKFLGLPNFNFKFVAHVLIGESFPKLIGFKVYWVINFVHKVFL